MRACNHETLHLVAAVPAGATRETRVIRELAPFMLRRRWYAPAPALDLAAKLIAAAA
jgi:hypothetical protein